MSLKRILGLVFVASAVACGSSTSSAPGPETGPAPPSASSATAAAESPPSPSADGSGGAKSCTTHADCEQGEVCSGEPGCDKAWTCQPSRPCTKDLVQYCGCDGKTFSSSGSCAGAKYSHKGPC